LKSDRPGEVEIIDAEACDHLLVSNLRFRPFIDERAPPL
jgi:hypothetical protein